VVNKPAGLNTHSPAPFAGEGLYDWLRHREPRWAALAIIHRLDKETSGVMVFAKSPQANRALTEQFASRQVRKKYLLLTDRPVKPLPLTVVSTLVRVGDRYASVPERRPPARPAAEAGVRAETIFSEVESQLAETSLRRLIAEPLTGRTHQIRVHAAESGFPILGDTLYGGTPAPRVCLHAAELAFRHPVTGQELRFSAPANFDADPRRALRTALLDPAETDAFRLIHGAADGFPGWQVDRLGDFLLSQSEQEWSPAVGQASRLSLTSRMEAEAGDRCDACPSYHKKLLRRVRQTPPAAASPQLVAGPAAPERFTIRENGVKFELSFNEGYSVGLFLDQRDNRRRWLTGHIAAGFPLAIGHRLGEILNVFAYTGGFSVCAALGGARTTSLDLSKKYLEWGKRNFALNGLDPAAHDFIFGDAFAWLRRLAKKGRAFDALALDPPTFAQSKESGVWQAERHYGKLVAAALPLLKPDGVLFASTNAADWPPEAFLTAIRAALAAAGRPVAQEHYFPQPPDFPVTRSEPAYLKTVWIRTRS
jgi:23S rRNA (cytosine1962-C5)-methyltransferase